MFYDVCLVGPMLSARNELLGIGGPFARPLYQFGLESHGGKL